MKKCRTCKTKFQPFSSLATACSPKCAIVQAKEAEEKKARKRLKEGREKLKTARDYMPKAQKVCNAYIRERDKNEPCISCGRYDHEIQDVFVGGKWDAGHYKSRGAYPELRFHPLNIHKQCKSCNGGSNKYAKKSRTVSEGYKERIIKKIGQEMVDWLGGYHPQNWITEDVKEIEAYYREQLKILKRGSPHLIEG